MVAASMITALAQKETAKQSLLKQLRETGATSPQMPGSLEVDGDKSQAALADLLAAGSVREARPGLYYLDETKAKEAKPGNGFVALLAILIIISITASLVALAVSAG
jgi:hypothetical protein